MSYFDLDTDWQLVSFDPPRKEQPAPVEVKGTCQKCGRHIGKGIAIHTKACNGHPAKAG